MTDIRRITPLEYGEARALWDVCFPEDAPYYSEWYFRRKTNVEYVLAAFEGGRMVSDLHAIPYDISIGGVKKRAAMVAGVATLPEFRHRGLAGAVIRQAHAELLASGVDCAILKPDVDFYRQFGYIPFSYHDEYSLSADQVAVPPAALHEPDETELLRIYSSFAKRFEGMMARTKGDMSTALEEAKLTGFAASSGAAYALAGETAEGLDISELAGDGIAPLVSALAKKYGRVSFRLPRGLDAGLPGKTGEMLFSMLCPLDTGSLLSGTGISSLAELLSRPCCTLEFC